MPKTLTYSSPSGPRTGYVVGYLPRGVMIDVGGHLEYVPSYLVEKDSLREVF